MNLFSELKRRNVFRVGLAYAVGAWLIAQVVQLAAESFDAPSWIMKMLIVVLIIGFPVTVFFSWAYELTPEGIRREAEVDRARSITHRTARRLDVLTIVLVLMAVGLVVWDRMTPGKNVPAVPASTAQQAADSPANGSADPGETSPEAEERSIAVLPFVNMSEDPENEYFADGLSEELLNRLAQIPALRVAGRTSSFEYKGQNRDLRQIARELGVANILEGSVRRSGEQVRITAQLIRASDGSHTWSQTYDRTLEDIFRTQDEIAERVATNLDVVMNEELRAAMRRIGVRNVDAFIAYQKGWELLIQAHSVHDVVPELERANEYFRKATELYPQFGDAWYWQTDRYQHVLLDPQADPEELELAARETERILTATIEHAQSPQQKAFANLTRAIWSDDWTGITVVLERALSLQTCVGPNWSELLYPFRPLADPSREAMIFSECVGKPDSPVAYFRVLESLLFADQPQQALALADEAIQTLGQTNATSALRVYALLALGRHDEAVAEAGLIDLSDPRFGHMPAVALAAAGNVQEARQKAETWLNSEDPDVGSKLMLHAFLGDTSRANELAASLDSRPAGSVMLASAILGCLCGAPFDLEATPNLASRLQEAGLNWPPAAPSPLPGH